MPKVQERANEDGTITRIYEYEDTLEDGTIRRRRVTKHVDPSKHNPRRRPKDPRTPYKEMIRSAIKDLDINTLRELARICDAVQQNPPEDA